jgi:hypothetical protein
MEILRSIVVELSEVFGAQDAVNWHWIDLECNILKVKPRIEHLYVLSHPKTPDNWIFIPNSQNINF